MYARIITAQVQHSQLDEASRLYREMLMPAAQQQPGFKGGWLLLDRHTGKSQAIFLWETESDLKAAETNRLLQQRIAQVAQTFVGTPGREIYEVSVLG